ncbi:hypothetical protein CRE_02949 [Caenorhabditis remanei]|uniref:Uncharacterized protein n=1 Tax=Caenorhabditis remanei TaxID=31234 RepID=E3LWV5_CAERE|nr:hypothetical protein CRE_02949 [Caenorhabditis remanei]
MSSVASKHALLIALGGFSIAALFVWYINKKDKGEREKKKVNDLVTNGSAVRAENGNLKKAQNGHANGAPGSISSSKLQKARDEEKATDVPVQNEKSSIEESRQKKSAEKQEVVTEKEETDHVAAGDRITVQEQQNQEEKENQVEISYTIDYYHFSRFPKANSKKDYCNKSELLQMRTHLNEGIHDL